MVTLVGTTLVLALLDADQLWVGNVGNSRAVFGNISGQAVAMSFDHKPCQLKEKKRIQEAGGFVAMNGVWRVNGVLATSRALGDYPLKVLPRTSIYSIKINFVIFFRTRKLLFLIQIFSPSAFRSIRWSLQVKKYLCANFKSEC